MNFKTGLAIFSSIFFLLLMMSEWSTYSYTPPKLEELKVAEGRLSFGAPAYRYGRPLYLLNGTIKTEFKCKLKRNGYGCQFDKQTREDIAGKFAKIWFREEVYFGSIKENRLYQLRVGDKLLVNFSDQKKRYLDSQSYDFIMYAVLFIGSLLMCLNFGWEIVKQHHRTK